jgi:hypothetical protein
MVSVNPTDPSAAAVLEHIPFVVRFDDRVRLLYSAFPRDLDYNNVVRVSIRRTHVLQDGFERLHELGVRLRDQRVQASK